MIDINQQKRVTIASCANDAFATGLIMSLASALAQSSGRFIYDFAVLDGGLTEQSQAELIAVLDRVSSRVQTSYTLRYLRPSKEVTQQLPTRVGNWMAYARLLLPELLPDADFAVYMDSDILAMRGVEGLWTRGMERQPQSLFVIRLGLFAKTGRGMTRSSTRTITILTLCLILMNLAWMRQEYPFSGIMNLINGVGRENIKAHDQTILNYITHGTSIEVERANNLVLATKYTLDLPVQYRDVNLHYVGKTKPWMRDKTEVRRFFAEYLYWRACEEYGVTTVQPRQLDEQNLRKVQKKSFWYRFVKPTRARTYRCVVQNWLRQSEYESRVQASDFFAAR